jgi:hypothetical protein
MIDFAIPLFVGALIGGLAVALPDLIADIVRTNRLRRAEQAVVRDAEALLRDAV